MSTRTRTGQSLVLFKFANTSMKLFYCLSIKPYGIVSFDMASYFDVIYKLLLLKFLDRKLCSEFYIGYSVRYKRNQVFFIQFVFISLQWFETMCTFNDAHLLHVHLLVCIFAHIPFVSIKRPFVSWFNIKYLMSVNCLLFKNLRCWNTYPDFIGIQQFSSPLLRHSQNINWNVYYYYAHRGAVIKS